MHVRVEDPLPLGDLFDLPAALLSNGCATYTGMDFPVADLLDDELSELWLLKHFHPKGLKCHTAPPAGRRPDRSAARAARR